jgi:hypothetical protein
LADFVEKVIELELWAGADAFLTKLRCLADPVIRIASGQCRIKRGSGLSFARLPQILGGRCKQEFIACAAWSSQPQSSEPQNSLNNKMGKYHFDAFALARDKVPSLRCDLSKTGM